MTEKKVSFANDVHRKLQNKIKTRAIAICRGEVDGFCYMRWFSDFKLSYDQLYQIAKDLRKYPTIVDVLKALDQHATTKWYMLREPLLIKEQLHVPKSGEKVCVTNIRFTYSCFPDLRVGGEDTRTIPTRSLMGALGVDIDEISRNVLMKSLTSHGSKIQESLIEETKTRLHASAAGKREVERNFADKIEIVAV
uniref:Uncharacterized protein n=1 Tax=Glossina morsitans morsitans TaxID=37546 RepID=A0A1B0G0G5_GLOMM